MNRIKYFSKYIKYLISLGLLAYLLTLMNMAMLWDGVLQSNKIYLACSVFFILGQIFFLNLRWHAFLNAGRKSVPFTTSTLINLAGYFANILFIAAVGGIIAKSALSIRYGVSVIHSLFATFLDRFMTLFALIILSAVGLFFLKGIIDHKIIFMLSLTIFFIIICIVMIAGVLSSGVLKDYILSNRKRSRVIATMRSFLENYPLMAKTTVYSLFAQVCFIVAVFILSLGYSEIKIPYMQFLAIVPILALISSLPISFGGWGVREGAFIYGLSLLGFSSESAFLLSVQVGLVTLIAPFLFSLPYLIQNKLHFLNNPNSQILK